ncbi:MAG: hypothetical protein OSJ70_09180 [Bacilli bacterium]|nr:hypothetical protein [Bacilli bacterium]
MEMFFKKISEEATKDIIPYIDAMVPYIDSLRDLYTVDINGHHYVFTGDTEKFVIVDNFKKDLDTYYLEFDKNGRICKYIDDLGEYELSLDIDGEVRGVRHTDKYTNAINQLIYFPALENDPTINIDFYQYFPEMVATAIFNYDVTRRDNTIEAALAYMQYNFPNRIVLSQLQFFLNIFSYKREQIFFEDVKNNKYARAAFKFRENLFPELNKRYPKEKVMYALEDMGYSVKVPYKMGDMLCGNDGDLKQLQLLTDEFKKRTKDGII